MSRWRRFRGLLGPEAGNDVDAELSVHVEMRRWREGERGVAGEELATPQP